MIERKSSQYIEPVSAELIVSIAAVLISAFGIFIAIRANGRSKDANRIAQRSLDAQHLALPPSWSSIRQASQYVLEIENTSGRHIVVTSYSVEPDAAASFATPRVELPRRVEYGDVLSFSYQRMLGFRITMIRLEWHFEDEETPRTTERDVP